MDSLLLYLSGCLSLCLVIITIKFINTSWWTPNRIQSHMRSQGIKGPSYRFLYGNVKEMIEMRKAIMSRPSELLHHSFPLVQPHFYSWIKRFGVNFLYWEGTKPVLVASESELIKEILNNKDGAYNKPDTPLPFKKLGGDGLILSGGEKWAKMRKLANRAFHAECLKNMTPAMVSSVEMMMERWRQHDGKEIDVSHEIKILTSDIISRTAFGSNYLEGQHIFDMLKKMILIVFRSHMKTRIPVIGKFIKTEDDIESDKLFQGIRDSIIKMVKKREEDATLEKKGNYGNDILGLLVEAHQDPDEAKHISIDELIDECKTFYVAGEETSTSLLCWTVFLLAIYTDWQEKTRNEVLELFGKANPTSDGISRLKTVSMVINETLRLYNPNLVFVRKAEREVRLGKITVPANMEIRFPTLSVHHNPEIWGEDVHQFKPERFADGVAKATNDNTAAFFPFGLGHRACVGTNFAIMEMKIAISMILQHYKFTLSPTYVHSPIEHLTMVPQHGIQIIVHKL